MQLGLQMWLKFLTNWNGIILFYDNDLTTASSLSLCMLYTVTSSPICFGGFFKNKWCNDKWPREVPSIEDYSESMAI